MKIKTKRGRDWPIFKKNYQKDEKGPGGLFFKFQQVPQNTLENVATFYEASSNSNAEF